MSKLFKHFQIIKRFQTSWVQPPGYDTGIKVYNCITKNKVPLIVANKNLVTWYTCGPTVYDSTHIGHASSYVKLDIIQRILKNYFNLNLVTCMNITDIDDKIVTKSKVLDQPIRNITEKYEKEFWEDLKCFGIDKPNFVVRVTQNMHRIIEFIDRLIKEDFAYLTSDNSVYFDVEKYVFYGKLQNIGQEFGAKGEKRSEMDFALWKAFPDEKISWHSPWGLGRPGWHIECSVLASHILGKNIDIHAGGIDLRFPHHENEEAQCCAYHKTTQWVNYWLHTGHLGLGKEEKMSKSLKNTISVQKMLETVSPDTFRMACLMTHYRSPMIYSQGFMTTAKNYLTHYKNFLSTCQDYTSERLRATINKEIINKLILDSSKEVYDALRNDFNTPQVISILNDVISQTNAMLHSTTKTDKFEIAPILGVSNFVVRTLELLGIDLCSEISEKQDSNYVEIVNMLHDFRQEVRHLGLEKQDAELLNLCDGIRDNLKKYGITIKDRGKNSSWSM